MKRANTGGLAAKKPKGFGSAGRKRTGTKKKTALRLARPVRGSWR